MKVLIDIPDEQAAVLQTKAAEQGLSLEAWLQQLARKSVDSPRGRYKLDDLIAACDLNAPRTDETSAWLNDAPVGNEAI